MRKLTAEEFEQLPVRGKGRSSHVFNSIVNLKIGEVLLVETKDWKRKASPSTLVRYIEKKYQMKFSCAALANGNGWVIKRMDSHTQQQISSPNTENERLKLKADILVFYLGRMTFQKIERIQDSVKACINHFWKEDNSLVKELFFEIIKNLESQGHIVIENEKTYIPLRKT